MVATSILQQERVEALARLRDTLGSLDGSNEQVVQETSERSGQSLVGRDFETAVFLDQVAQVLVSQQERIEALEKAAAPRTRGSRKK